MKLSMGGGLSAMTVNEMTICTGGDDPCGSSGGQTFATRVGQVLGHVGEFIHGFFEGFSTGTRC